MTTKTAPMSGRKLTENRRDEYDGDDEDEEKVFAPHEAKEQTSSLRNEPLASRNNESTNPPAIRCQ